MRMHPASCAVTRLGLFFHNIPLGPATGFLYNYAQETCLISNWHVFSGRNATTMTVMNKDGIVPNRVEFHITCAALKERGVEYSFAPMDVPLVSDGVIRWWQHSGYVDGEGKACIVDIGVLPLNEAIP
jgi:hypothetical protein